MKLFISLLFLILVNINFGQNVKILTYNIKMLPKICNLVNTENQYSQETRLEWIIDYLDTVDAEVVELQEVFDNDAVNELALRLRHKFPFIEKPRNKLFKFTNGLMVLSKFPLKKEKDLFFSKLLFQDFFTSKGASLYSVQLPLKKIFLINTHLQSDYDFATSHNLRKSQLDEIYTQLIEPIQNTSEIILAGDFNFDEIAEEYNYCLSKFCLKDAKQTKSHCKTFSENNCWNKGVKSEKLDYFFTFSCGSETIRIQNHQLIENKKFNQIDFSDHHALLIELSFEDKYLALEK